MKTIHIGIGDLHGHLKALEVLLIGLEKKLGIFEAGDKLHPHVNITFTGDYIDRGKESKGVIERIMGLQTANPDQITTLCGNHELLALSELEGLASLVKNTEEDKAEEILHYYSYGLHGGNGGLEMIRNFGDTPIKAAKAYLLAMHRDQPIGGWIRKLKTLSKVKSHGKSILFVHGGIPQHLSNPKSLEDYAAKVQVHMETRTGVAKGYSTKYGIKNELVGRDSVFWDRTIPKGSGKDAEKLCKNLDVDYIVIGHTPQREGQIANYGNRIFNIDIGMCPDYGENEPGAILFDKDGPHAFYANRGIEPLTPKKEREGFPLS